MKRIHIAMIMIGMLATNKIMHGYTYSFFNRMPGPVDVRIKLAGINEPWYTEHLSGAKEKGLAGKHHEFVFAARKGVPGDMARKFGLCLKSIQVQPYEYDEMEGTWVETGRWYDVEPLFVTSETYQTTLRAASQFADGLNKAAGNTLKLISKGLKYMPTRDEEEQVEEVAVSVEPELTSEDVRLIVVSPALQKAVAARDLYTVLGVSRQARQDEIRSAYKRKALQWHPDKNKGNETVAEAKFKEIAVAYDILGDQDKRKAYDNKTFVIDEAAQAVVQNENGDWQLKPEESVSVVERMRSGLRKKMPTKKAIDNARKTTKSIRKTIEAIPLNDIIDSVGTFWSHSMCKSRVFEILPNIDTDGQEHEGPIVTTKAK